MLYTVYIIASAIWFGMKAVFTTVVPAKIIEHLSPASHKITFVELYFARFFGLALSAVVAFTLLGLRQTTPEPASIVLLTTLLHAASAGNVLNYYRLTKQPGMVQDALGSLVLAGLGTFLATRGPGAVVAREL